GTQTNMIDLDLRGFVKHFKPTIEHKKKRNHKDDNTGGQQTQVESQTGVYGKRKIPHVQIDTKQWCSATHELVAVSIELGDSDIKDS
ncbi:hypothetical protein HPB47_000672, partial [Ixodes persulcatus]